MTKEQVKAVLDRILTWPRERQEELAAIALELEAEFGDRLYQPTSDELEALEEAENSGVANPESVEAAYKAFRRS